MINIAQNFFVLLIISSKFCFSKTWMLSLSAAISHMRLRLMIAPLHALLPNIAQKICFPRFTSDPRYRLHGRKANNISSRTRRDCSSQTAVHSPSVTASSRRTANCISYRFFRQQEYPSPTGILAAATGILAASLVPLKAIQFCCCFLYKNLTIF